MVALALVCSPSLGCGKKNNSTEQQPAEGSGAAPGAMGSGTNPNLPNPTNAGAEQTGSAAGTPAENAMVGDAGVDASGAAGSAAGSAEGSAAGSATK
jgi:hypothetical protein